MPSNSSMQAIDMYFLADITYTLPSGHIRHIRRLRALQEEIASYWDAYLNLGSKFFTNIPLLPAHDPSYDDAFQPRIFGLHNLHGLSAGFDPAYNFRETVNWLMFFNYFREGFELVDYFLQKDKVSTARNVLFTLERRTGQIADATHMIENDYEDGIAGLNALAATGRLPEVDAFAQQRMESFEAWSKLVRRYTRTKPENAQEWAESWGWTPLNQLDSDSDSESNPEPDWIEDTDEDGDSDSVLDTSSGDESDGGVLLP